MEDFFSQVNTGTMSYQRAAGPKIRSFSLKYGKEELLERDLGHFSSPRAGQTHAAAARRICKMLVVVLSASPELSAQMS